MPKYQKLLPIADKGFVVNNNCIACGTCRKVCPCENIELKGGKPDFLHKCALCMACVSYCPKKAIDYDIKNVDDPEHEKALKNFLVKRMKLTNRRKRYHNPYVTAAEIEKNLTHLD